MDEKMFWALIEKAKKDGSEDFDARADSLKEGLLRLSESELVEFDSIFQNKSAQAYRWDLWGAAYIINGGCSDDGFEYFCNWLISEGKLTYDSVLKDPEILAEIDEPEEFGFEEIGYLAAQAYEEKFDRDFPYPERDFPDEPEGRKWKESELENLFPALSKKYG